MAEKLIRQLVDDIDGSEATYTRRFTIDGKSYRIDLSEKNNDKFDKAVAAFVEHASLDGTGRRARVTAKSSRDYDLAALREWAVKNKVEVPQRGRIPAATVERFKAARRK